MKKKVYSLLSVLLVIVMIAALAGCTQGGDSSGTTTDTGTTTAKSADELYFAVSLGWMENASGQRQKFSFESAFAENGVTNFDIVDANYDAKKQSEQIEAFIAKKPDALFITPSDPVGIAEATKKAAEAGIKVFCSDGYVPGAEVVSSVMFDNYAGGMATMKHLGDLLLEKYPSGDIGIAMITLPSNEGWDAREHGADYILSQEKYSRIKVIQEWPWDSTGAVTPTDTISSWMAADTKKEIKAIWCAWDGAAFEGLAVTATTRPEIMYTGSDGGEECYKKMQQYPEQFVMTLAESVYAMPNQLVGYAMTSINGGRVPRIVMSAGYAITSDMILDVYSIKDKTTTVNGETKTAWELALDYDLPGYTDALNEVLEKNGLDPGWVPEI
ncbi:MAG: sugar ABC transporter substrate-binding protein [Lachnospiraceae bacterium]|jgi:ribose transport system substrate-binding protein|nr:sugar ABC transporter substrate-binding protein [Lachnospiraceae bacterium]